MLQEKKNILKEKIQKTLNSKMDNLAQKWTIDVLADKMNL